MENFDLLEYMNGGIERVVKSIVKASLFDIKQNMFMMRFAENAKKAYEIRKKYEEEGKHIPPILICSITSKCNLHCAGCYARAIDSCNDDVPTSQLTAKEWEKIFLEARDLGISFIILIGGEPMMRKDVLEVAGNIPEILFPVFTNGTMFDEEYINLFAEYKNLLPVFSIEGDIQNTDLRRGQGTYQNVLEIMEKLRQRKIIFGTSITVTSSNLEEVTSSKFVQSLYDKGSKLGFYVEFVPTSEASKKLVINDEQREVLMKRVNDFREEFENMVIVAFPGDEKSSGGCMAAGRGFFHVNSHGGAEPCPFSPYSDINIKNTSLLDAIDSKLFKELQLQDVLNESHIGGCVLYEKREQVEKIVNNKS
ncbi:MAG: radical SAM protein [Clostridia bacterium]|nr:radical SAM protein [Clostridia bacterium]